MRMCTCAFILAIFAIVSARTAHAGKKRPNVAGDAVPTTLDSLVQINLYRGGDDSICTGTMLQPGYIVSSASCFIDANREPLDTQQLEINLGGFLPSIDAASVTIWAPSEYHPNQQAEGAYNRGNIAIVYIAELEELIADYALEIDYPKLPAGPAEVEDASTLVIAGVGLDGEGRYTGNAHYAAVVRVDASTVLGEPDMDESTALETFKTVEADHILTIGAENGGGSRACEGDNGAPLLIPSTRWPLGFNASEHDVLVGVHSFSAGDACGEPGTYDAFVDVLPYASWIKAILEPVPDPWSVAFPDTNHDHIVDDEQTYEEPSGESFHDTYEDDDDYDDDDDDDDEDPTYGYEVIVAGQGDILAGRPFSPVALIRN